MEPNPLIRVPLILTAIFVSLSGCGHPAADRSEHAPEASKALWTAYSDAFELFIEADPLVVGQECRLLAHLTQLSDFKPFPRTDLAFTLTVNGSEVRAERPIPVRPGIFELFLVPRTAGEGRLTLRISSRPDGCTVDGITVFPNPEAAQRARQAASPPPPGVPFTKEMSWKVDFATSRPQEGVFREAIHTSARIQSALADEVIVTAKASGVVRMEGGQVLEGGSLSAGQNLCSIAGGGIAENNLAVRVAEARNNYERTRADFRRAESLAKDRIVSEKELARVRNEHDNAKAVFDNLPSSVRAGALIVSSPFSGFVKQVFVRNGQHVTAGQPLFTVSQNRRLLIRADVRPQHAARLGQAVSAVIRTPHDNRTYTLEQLNGRLLPFGQSVNEDNYLVPVSLQVDNPGGLMPGLIVELFLRTTARPDALSLPLTAIVEEQGLTFVYVQVHPELFARREVKLGGNDGMSVEILSGLGREERVVTRGAIMVKLSQAAGSLDAHSGHAH